MFKKFIWAFTEKGGQFILQFFGVAIMGRFLSPQEYGVYGIMMIFVTISEQLIDSGFGGALVQKKEISQDDINTLFTSNLLISIVLYLLLFLIAPSFAKFYGLPQLSQYLRVLGLVVILYALTIVQMTLLQRELRFRKSALITLLATLISVCGAIAASICGYGIWSLIFQSLLMAGLMALFLWTMIRRHIGLKINLQSFKSLWSFGSRLLAANLLQTAYNNISTSIIPKISSMRDSGLFFQANRINGIPVGILQTTIDKAAFPILSKEKNSEELLAKARILNNSIFAVVLPFFPLLSIFSSEALYIALGPQWVDGALYLQILSWGGVGLLMQTFYRNIIKSQGKTSKILYADILKVVIGLIVLTCAIPFGTIFLVSGLTMTMFVGTFIYMMIIKKEFNFKCVSQLSDFIKPMANAIICYVSFYLLHNCLDFHWYNIFLAVGYCFEYALLAYLLRMRELTQLINHYILRRKYEAVGIHK